MYIERKGKGACGVGVQALGFRNLRLSASGKTLTPKPLKNKKEKEIKKMEKKGSTKGGIGFLGLLQIAFIVLKLIGVIKWSWLWVLCPTWIPIALLIIVLIPIVIFFIVKIIKG